MCTSMSDAVTSTKTAKHRAAVDEKYQSTLRSIDGVLTDWSDPLVFGPPPAQRQGYLSEPSRPRPDFEFFKFSVVGKTITGRLEGYADSGRSALLFRTAPDVLVWVAASSLGLWSAIRTARVRPGDYVRITRIPPASGTHQYRFSVKRIDEPPAWAMTS